MKEANINYKKTVLPNGLTILSEEIGYVESFSLGIGIRAGSRDDHMSLPGIAHFVEHAVYRRTKNRTSRQIANQFDSIGAYSNAYTTKEHTIFYVKAIKHHFEKTLDLLADIVLNPLFKKSEIDKERQIIIEEIKSYDDDPEEFIFDLADSIVFQGNTIGNSIDGTIESLKKIDSEVLLAFHNKYYHPENIIISLSGNVSHERLVDEVTKYFGIIRKFDSVHSRLLPSKVSLNEEINKPIQQAHLILGKQTISGNHPDRFTASILNIIFGDGLSSRIYQNLREKMGLAYSVFSSINFYTDCGALYLYIATDKSNLKKSEDALYSELRKLHSSKITKVELQRAKEQIKTARILEFESMSTRMQSLIKNEMMLGRYESIEEITQMIDAVSIDDLYRIAREYYNDKDWCKIQLNPTE